MGGTPGDERVWADRSLEQRPTYARSQWDAQSDCSWARGLSLPSKRRDEGQGSRGEVKPALGRPWVLMERGLEPELGGNPGGSPGLLTAELHPGPGARHGLLLWAGCSAPLTTKQDRGPESPQPRRREAGSW